MPTPAELAAKLHPPRLPVSFSELTWQDAVGAFGTGLLIGIVIYVILRVLLTRKASFPERVARDLQDWRTLPGPERHYRQTRLWGDVSRQDGNVEGAVPPWLDDLYRPDARVDHDALDREILTLARKRRR